MKQKLRDLSEKGSPRGGKSNADFLDTFEKVMRDEMMTMKMLEVIDRINQIDKGPLQACGASRFRVVGIEGGIEPDCGFLNLRVPADLAECDANKTRVTVIVIETALSKSWRSVRTYFTLAVLHVVYFKLSEVDDLNRPSQFHLNQMYRMDFRRPENYVAEMPIIRNAIFF